MITRMLQSLTEREPIDSELQRHLSESGYYGRTAKCLSWQLVGVVRPGWIQVFEFHVRAKRQGGDWEEKFGVCRTDERDGTYEIQLFNSQEACQVARESIVSGMITHGRGTGHWAKTLLMGLFFAALAIATIGAVLSLMPPVTPNPIVEPN